jgi:hypothetical protein
MAGALSKKAGPLPRWAWFAVAVGVGGVYILYKRHEASSAANSADALSGSTAVPTTGNGQGVTTTTGTGPSFSDFGSWEAAALSVMGQNGIGGADALNAITNWINGACVSAAAYQALSQVITNSGVGLPPGFGTSLPSLSVCPSSSTPPTSPSSPAPAPTPTPKAPALPASVAAAMAHNNEHLVGAPQWDPKYGTWLFLTNKGGIYAVNQKGQGTGAGFFGSIFSLPDHFANWVNGSGQYIRQAASLTVEPNGGYIITDTAGEKYDFHPTPA